MLQKGIRKVSERYQKVQMRSGRIKDELDTLRENSYQWTNLSRLMYNLFAKKIAIPIAEMAIKLKWDFMYSEMLDNSE